MQCRLQDSRVREVSETIRVPILSTATRDKKKTAQRPVIALQPAAVSDDNIISDTVLKPAVENVPMDSDSVAEKISLEQPPMDILESSASETSSVEVSEAPSDERTVNKEYEEQVQIDDSKTARQEKWSHLMHCVKNVWNFIG